MTQSATSHLADKSPNLIPLGDGLNFSAPLDRVNGTVVPTAEFFVRSNNPPPALTAEQWSLRIDGLVRTPLTVRLADLTARPSSTHEVWMECAGNGRSHFSPPTEGNQWNDFAVSDATFTGVSLGALLDEAGVAPGAVEVVASGADVDAKGTSFQRGLPLDAALLPEVLLAWDMNGAPIPSVNGGPVRLIVPRWAGIASVKWLTHLELVDQPFLGYFNAERYIFVDADGKTLRTVREMPVKSIIASPSTGGARLARGKPTTVFGFAWSGHGPITRVDVSTDGGTSWSAARLRHGQGSLAWTRWEWVWTPAQAGRATISARATDASGNVQPAEATWNKFGYEMNAILKIEVVVDG
jgi:DMSO/TMAO reductase YedYZ molybdopterin-dependent catalytic subunit